jgi:hypothetical protein
MVDYAQQLVEQTTDPVALKRTYDMLSPFNPALKKKAMDD